MLKLLKYNWISMVLIEYSRILTSLFELIALCADNQKLADIHCLYTCSVQVTRPPTTNTFNQCARSFKSTKC